MTRAEAINLGIKPATIDAEDVDISRLVVAEEFKRKHRGDGYRERAIDRLVSMRVDWHTEWNITHDAVKRFMAIRCPYCGAEMTARGGGGNSAEQNVTFRCECGASVGVTLPSVGGMTFAPPKVAE